jgi:hypothetical protein
MELTPDELAKLLAARPLHGGAPVEGASLCDAATHGHLLGTRCLIRTRISGVSVGLLRSVSTSAAGWSVVLDDAIRVWSWEGALACSTLAIDGPTSSKTERHPDGIVIADQGMEIVPVSEAAWSRFSK